MPAYYSISRQEECVRQSCIFADNEAVGPVNVPMEKLPALNKSSDENWQRAKADKGGGVLGSLEGAYYSFPLSLSVSAQLS